MPTPKQLLQLCQRFERNLDAYKQGRYKEAQLRREFIDPLFELIGWDMYNKQGYAEAYKEVIHEDAITVGGATKAPDYCFRIGGVRKFFMETKKPSIDIKGDIHPAYQLRRYAWSAKLPLSILTDFEELAVYDCRIKPSKTDKAATARILYLTHKDYPKQWDQFVGIFSPDAIRKGSFDKWVEEKKTKRGTAEVDAAFLAEIERWRDLLARNIALRNPRLSQRELNFATQRTIDRIIFLRICEDRGIEPYGQLMALQNGERVYKRLMEHFHRADDRYNSGMFHFEHEEGRPDESIDALTLDLVIDDKVLKDIFKNLYYPDSPYEFSVLPADILGQVYEQFLGKVIRLTPGHRAVVEDKPEVRKAGGVYYTPTYIVDYIVKQTVGKLLEGKKPGPRSPVNKLRILDPACGSGSFLLGAYQYLLDWHRDQYIADDPRKWSRGRSPKLFKTDSGEWKLTIEERKRILMNNIYGVDIDRQAVEVTKLSLLLKVMEDEQSVVRQLSFFRERVLPDLGNNIKCGNSLIGPDFWEGKQMTLLDDEEMLRINAFDWEVEFPEIMKAGGFDAVIGNPPYVRQELLSEGKSHFQSSFKVYQGTADLYVYFIEKGVSLLRPEGIFCFIVANKWLRANYGKPLRRWLKEKKIIEITDFGDLPVFKRASSYPCILRVRKGAPELSFKATQVKTLKFFDLKEYVLQNRYPVRQKMLDDNGWSLVDVREQTLFDELYRKSTPLGEYVSGKIYRGILTGLNEAFVIDEPTRKKLISEDSKSGELIKPFLLGKDVKRYQPPCSSRYLIFTRRGTNIREYPAILQHLLQFKERLMPKPPKWSGGKWLGRKPGPYQWYEIQDTIAYYKEFEKPKIILPAIVQTASYTFDNQGFYSNDKTSIIPTNDLYLLGLLNSRLLDLVLHSIASTKRGGYYEYKPMYIQQLPIRIIDFSKSGDKTKHDKMVTLVERNLDLHKKLAVAKPPQAKTSLKRQIEATERQIDELVYEVYGLTEKEIKIVEESLG